MSTKTIRLIRDGEKGCVWRWGGGGYGGDDGVGLHVLGWYGGGAKGRLYTYRYTVTTRMTPAQRGERKRNAAEAHLLTPHREARSAHNVVTGK